MSVSDFHNRVGYVSRQATAFNNIRAIYNTLDQFGQTLKPSIRSGSRFGEIISRRWIATIQFGQGEHKQTIE